MPEPVWPSVQDGSLQGGVTTTLSIDRSGVPHDITSIISENAAVNEAGRKAFEAMRFKPFLVNGQPVQVVATYTIPFKTTRPVGTETFDSARNYFEHARMKDFPAAGANASYVLHATFESGTKSGKVEIGNYLDTWISDIQWRRETSIANSHLIKTRDGEKYYLQTDGEDVPTLRLLLKAMEPIPAIDTFVESDWRIRRETIDGVSTIRVATGAENADGKLDAEHGRGYWFSDSGDLLRAHFLDLDLRRSDFQPFGSVNIARRVDVYRADKLGMRINITDISAVAGSPKIQFKLKGHEWQRQFTDEVR
jgi:hypothetical protein